MEELQFELPWSVKKLRKLGEALRDGTPIPAGGPEYAEVMLYYSSLAEAVQRRIADLDWGDLIVNRPFEVTARPKTIDTLVQKLQRDHSTPLPNVQDIAGVRFEAELNLSEQDAVVDAIRGIFDQPSSCVHDLRTSAHSGYRAVHLWLRLPARVEVQVRTHLQGRWANMYESAADALGREIRYGVVPRDPGLREYVHAIQQISTDQIAQIENARDEMERIEATLADQEGRAGNWLVNPAAPRQSRNTELLSTVDALKEEIQSLENKLESDLAQLKSMFEGMKKG